ncbi:MAG: tetratricopeptide repeat protein [Bacteriovorax sp.]|jgi:tetratricopeptide (TPR) repeat protein
MSVKYRIRLQNDRVIGPFTTEEIGELYLKNHITGDEVCQQFPIGDWRNINSYPGLNSLIQKIQSKNLIVSTSETGDESGKDATKADLTHSGLRTFKEFKFGKENVNIGVDYQELEKKYKKLQPAVEEVDDGKTRVVKKGQARPSPEMEKTVVIPSKASVPKKDSTETRNKKELEGQSQKKDIESKEVEKILTQEELMNEKTEFLNLATILPTINAQLSVSEVELDQKKRIEENNEKIRLKELQEQIEREESEEELDEEEDEDYNPNDLQPEYKATDSEEPLVKKKPKKKRNKGMSLIVALAFLGIFYVLMTPDEKPAVTGPLFLEVKFPITQEYEDKPGASAALIKGRSLYSQNNYLSRSVASRLYVESLQKQFSSNEALGDLVLTYAELIDNTTSPKLASNTVYKLIQLSENKILSDLNVVTGTSLFYGKIGKYQTGINVVKNYFRAKNPPSSKLLAYYLELLINAGDLVEARKIFTMLKGTAKKPIEAYYHLAKFCEIDNQPAEARSVIDEGLKYFPNSVQLLLVKADYLFKDQSEKKYEETLKKINQLNSEGSPVFTARFYYHMGLLSALKKKNPEATAFFKKSLAIKESDELRSMLSTLEVGGDKFAQSLILESKVLDLIKKANAEIKNKNLEAAFSYSIEAIDASPDYVPAILLQTQLQLKRGLFDSAIDTLQKAIALNPGNNLLKKSLVTAYIRSYKFQEAQTTLMEISQTKYSLGPEYASLMGDFYYAKNNIPLAVPRYSEALNRDPLSDYDMFQLAKIYIRMKNFKEARSRLAKALLLDPKNPEYLAANAEILFEQDNTDIGIGYLRDAISEIGEDPKLVSTIATLYYKSGQLKDFNNYYRRIQALPKKDESFYEFLIYAAKVEEKTEDYISYSRELLKLNPGNLKVRLDLGEFLMDKKRYPDALAEFEEIRSKLSSYPKVHYMLARVFLALNDIAKAKEMAKKELELNPSLDTAHFIVGEVARIEKDYREAILKYEKAISLNPKSVDALMAMAWIRLAQNYANEAVELYNRALREDRANPEIHKQMGLAYKAAGQRALAKEKFEDYLKLSPGATDREQIETQIRNLQ